MRNSVAGQNETIFGKLNYELSLNTSKNCKRFVFGVNLHQNKKLCQDKAFHSPRQMMSG